MFPNFGHRPHSSACTRSLLVVVSFLLLLATLKVKFHERHFHSSPNSKSTSSQRVAKATLCELADLLFTANVTVMRQQQQCFRRRKEDKRRKEEDVLFLMNQSLIKKTKLKNREDDFKTYTWSRFFCNVKYNYEMI